MMLWGANLGSLELRFEGGETRLRASFPYGAETVLAPRWGAGRERREVIAPRAFSSRVISNEDIHFLAGHDFNRPLASRSAGSLTIEETDAALNVEAVISAEMAQVSYVRDFLAAHSAGLVRGLSPGFRVSAGGEKITENRDAIVRTIHSAELVEISAVTKPAYPQAQIEARNWKPVGDLASGLAKAHHATSRWR